MKDIPLSVLLGPLFIALLFILSAGIVIGVKTLLSFLFPRETPSPAPPQKVVKPRPKPIRSIEINPEEVDRIYVRKQP